MGLEVGDGERQVKLPRLTRTRSRSRSSPASNALQEYEDVVPGEGGEPAAPATIDGSIGDDYDTMDYGSNDVGTISGK